MNVSKGVETWRFTSTKGTALTSYAIKHATTQDSWDCEGTQSCCDYILFRMCCTDGTAVQEQWVPVPIPVRPNDGYPGPYSGRAAHR